MRPVRLLLSATSIVLAACGGSGSSTAPTSLAVSIPQTPIQSGNTIQAVATFTDGSGASGVAWSTSNSQVASITSSGAITGHVVGSATITAKANGLTGTVNIGVIPGAPARIVIVAGNGQTGSKGSVLSQALCTAVWDAAGNYITGVTVDYVVGTGGGSLAAPTSPSTGSGGIAISGLWTLGPGVGQQSVTASTSVGSVTFTANAQ